MQSDKRQTFAMIGIALIVVAGILVYIGVSQPKIYESVQPQSSASSVAAENNSIEQSGSNNVVVQNSGNGNVNVVVSTTQESVRFPINLNTATVDDLMQISGLGEVRANAIVAYRNQIGQFDSVEQIMQIKGIGEGIYAKVAPYITV